MTEPGWLRISELAERSGTNPPTIRYYEQVGLLPRAVRQGGGQRRYSETDVRRLVFIRRCRAFDFSVDQVRQLLDLAEDPTRDCSEVLEMAGAHLLEVRAKLAELRALERDIESFVHRCATRCAGGPGPSCEPLMQLGSAAPRTVASVRAVGAKARQ